MPAGRPTDYKPEYPKLVLDYIKTCGREQTRLPKRVDIALLLDCDEDTLNNWAKEHGDFFGALTRVDMTQKGQLMDDGLYGGKEVNPQIAKFLLNANHGVIETTREEHTGKGGKDLFPVPILGSNVHTNDGNQETSGT
jgi:hypothetical protein